MDLNATTGIAGRHHARLINENVPMHIIWRTFQGRHLLQPSPTLNELVIGVLGRAREIYPQVKLYAAVFMSNHVHLLAQGPADELPFFIGFIKREISRRWGGRPEVDWPGAMWHEYIATALPTTDSQIRCLKYILSQGVKENLVEKPQDWPGVHCAQSLLRGAALTGRWLDATSYCRARDAEKRKRVPRVVRRSDFLHDYAVTFDPLPVWHDLDGVSRQGEVKKLVDDIVEDARLARARTGVKQVLGAIKVMQVLPERRTELPVIPWFEDRRRMICWADPRAPEVKAYLADYWCFQEAFAAASRRFIGGELDVDFPPRAFRPRSYRAPPAQMS